MSNGLMVFVLAVFWFWLVTINQHWREGYEACRTDYFGGISETKSPAVR